MATKAKEVKKDHRYYYNKMIEGIDNVTKQKTPYQKRRTFERMMAKLTVEKPYVDPSEGTMWGSQKVKGGK